MTVAWRLNGTAPDTALWEQGVTLKVPAGMTRMRWQRDSYFADYPAGHLGEPSGSCLVGDPRFRASKQGLNWMTLTDDSGVGIAWLPTSTPLIGRADSSISDITLRVSREVAGPRGLIGIWVQDHVIHAVK